MVQSHEGAHRDSNSRTVLEISEFEDSMQKLCAQPTNPTIWVPLAALPARNV